MLFWYLPCLLDIDPGLALTLFWFPILHLCCPADTDSWLPDHPRSCICLLASLLAACFSVPATVPLPGCPTSACLPACLLPSVLHLLLCLCIGQLISPHAARHLLQGSSGQDLLQGNCPILCPLISCHHLQEEQDRRCKGKPSRQLGLDHKHGNMLPSLE